MSYQYVCIGILSQELTVVVDFDGRQHVGGVTEPIPDGSSETPVHKVEGDIALGLPLCQGIRRWLTLVTVRLDQVLGPHCHTVGGNAEPAVVDCIKVDCANWTNET